MGYNIAFSGLSATAEAIDVTSNNIANAQTVGYKAGEFMFADEFFRAQDPQSMDRSGMGTARQGIRRDMNYGTVTDTQNPLDVALTGAGMFVLAKNTSGTVPTQTPDTFQFTRNGQFGVDANNRIVNENGMFVVGYPANTDGKSINKAQFSILTLDQSPMPAKQTTASTIAMNLDNRGNPIQATFDPTQVNSYTQTTSQTVYDAGGNQHTLSTYYAKQNPATLYFYPQNGGTNPTTATVFAFNPNQDISAAADNFTATQNLTSVPSGVDAAHSLATTATPATGAAVTNETLSGVTLTAYPPGQTSTYQMTMSDGTQIMVTAQQTTNAQGQNVVRYGYAADRYSTYVTVDGINVNRAIATTSQIGQGYAPSSSLTGSVAGPIPATGAVPGVAITSADDVYNLSQLTLRSGDTVALGGVTFTATGQTTGAQLATQFAAFVNSGTAGTTGGFTGTFNAAWKGTAIDNGSGTLTLSATNPGAATTNLGSAVITNASITPAYTAGNGTSTYSTDAYNLASLNLSAGQSITLGGVTFTATASTTGASLATQYAAYLNNGTVGTSGTFSGALGASWAGATVATDSGSGLLTLTANTVAGPVANIGVATVSTPANVPAFTAGVNGSSKDYTVSLAGGGTAVVTVAPNGSISNVVLSGGSGYVAGQSIVIPAGALGVGSASVTLPAALSSANIAGVLDASYSGTSITASGLTTTNPTTPIRVGLGAGNTAPFVDVSLTVNAGNITGYTIVSEAGSSNVVPEGTTQITIPRGTNGSTAAVTLPIGAQPNDFLGTTVSNVSVGGALTGSAAAGNYTIGAQQVIGGLTGPFTPPSTVAGLGGIAGTYTVALQSTNGTGSGGVATINYGGNGTITSIQLSGGTGYSNDTITIPAGSLGAGSAALQLGTIGAANLVNGTQLTLTNGSGTPIPSAQTVINGSNGGQQTFAFSNGVSFTLNTPLGDSAAGIAAGLSGRVITVANNPVGTMAFVAGKNTDGLQRDQFGVPAYTTKTSLSTTVGSATRVNQLAITIDSTDMTAYSAAQSTYKNTQDGNTQAQLTAYMVDNSGILQATYDNGQTLMKGQLAIANFNNNAGLIPVGNNSFEMSGITGLQSGDAIYGTANTGNLGAIRSKAVESSNVDLTAELVKLMTLQRQYTANSQAVKVEAATIVDDAIRIGQ